MGKFIFRLDRVLRIRRAEKQQLQLELSRVYGLLNGLDEQRKAVQCRLNKSKEAPDRLLAQRYGEKLERELALLDGKEERLCEEAAQLLVKMDRAQAKVKTLERLREKRLQRHKKKEQRKADNEGSLLNRNRLALLS